MRPEEAPWETVRAIGAPGEPYTKPYAKPYTEPYAEPQAEPYTEPYTAIHR